MRHGSMTWQSFTTIGLNQWLILELLHPVQYPLVKGERIVRSVLTACNTLAIARDVNPYGYLPHRASQRLPAFGYKLYINCKLMERNNFLSFHSLSPSDLNPLSLSQFFCLWFSPRFLPLSCLKATHLVQRCSHEFSSSLISQTQHSHTAEDLAAAAREIRRQQQGRAGGRSNGNNGGSNGGRSD